MKFLIFGATGLVGSSLTKQLSQKYQVTAAVRGSTNEDAKSYKERVINFEEFHSFELLPYDGVYCCLGTTIKKAGSKDSFKRVDLDYVLMCYQYALKTKAKFFCVISALGASADSKIFYSKVKGNMESSLDGPIKTIIVRPSLLIGDREELRIAEKISLILLRPFSKFLTSILGKYAPIKSEDVAKSMIDLSLEGSTPIKIEYLLK